MRGVLGEVVKAGSIAELADKMGLSGAAKTNFEATVSAYNTSVRAGSDSEGFKTESAYLTKRFEQGDAPFYAVKLYPESHISMGGPVTDTKCRVLKQEFAVGSTPGGAELEAAVIPHLYAVGEFANRALYNVNYVGAVSLTSYPAMGRIAALDAAKDCMVK